MFINYDVIYKTSIPYNFIFFFSNFSVLEPRHLFDPHSNIIQGHTRRLLNIIHHFYLLQVSNNNNLDGNIEPRHGLIK